MHSQPCIACAFHVSTQCKSQDRMRHGVSQHAEHSVRMHEWRPDLSLLYGPIACKEVIEGLECARTAISMLSTKHCATCKIGRLHVPNIMYTKPALKLLLSRF